MLKIILKVYNMAGDMKGRYIRSIIFSFIESSFANVPFMMLLVMLYALMEGTLTKQLCMYLFLGMIVGVVLRGIFRYLVNERQQGTGFIIFAKERKRIGERLKRYPMGYYSNDGVGNISSVMTSDLLFIEDGGVGAMGNFMSSFIGTIVSMIFILILDIRMGLVLIGSNILIAIGIIILRKYSIIGAAQMQTVQKDLIGSVIDYLKGMPIIKAFNLVEGNHKKTSRDFDRYHKIQLNYEVKMIWIISVIWALTGGGTAALIYSSGYYQMQGVLAVPFVILFMIMSFQMYAPILLITMTTATISIAGDGLERYDKVLNMEVIDEAGKDIELNNFDIEFKDVTFGYEKREILHDINFRIKENTMTALVGKSGSGKSTIMNLIARFWDVKKGIISIGGVDIKELTIDSLYKNIAMVFQKVYLFNDTIYNNIAFGKKDATREEVIEASKKARCHDFIMSLENGYDTEVGEGGNTLSGGEKQRISIARAILKDAPIILLDEATASIDPENEAFIQEAISELIRSKTLVVIAHKLSSIKNADQILVIDDGNIIESGVHEELVALEGEYAKLWNLRKRSQSWEISGSIQE